VRRRAPRPAVATAPVDAPLLDALKAWRMRASDGKPAYTVAHNRTLEPAPGGRLQVTFSDSPDLSMVAAICRVARDRAWRAYRAVEGFVSDSGTCRRRALLDHFGDARPGDPAGRCCDVCDPATIGLPDPASLTPVRRRAPRPAAATAPVDAPLLDALKAWRMRASDGKPAYTVAHNRTLEAIAALKPSTLEELATIKGVGPAFVDRHGAQVIALLAGAGA
jgi:ATP-dependent DNA helicase RecQ